MLLNNTLPMKILPVGQSEYTIDLNVSRVGCSRNSSRDIDATKQYISDIKKTGYKMHGPAGIAFKSRYLLTNETLIEVQGPQTSGEAEFVIFTYNDSLYVSVGSDHNDRSLGVIWTEMLGKVDDTAKSKQMVPAVIAGKAWLYDEIKEHWDKIIVSSKVTFSGKLVLYQQYELSQLLNVEHYLDNEKWVLEEGSVLLGGSGPLVDPIPEKVYKGQKHLEDVEFPNDFHFEIFDPILNRSISHSYEVISLEPSGSLSL